MNKKEALKVLFQNPFGVIVEGIRAREQKYYKSKLFSKYGITQLPTIDFLDLFPELDETISNYSFLKGTSLITDLLLLKSFAKSFESCSYLEIGSFRGESISNISDVTNDSTSITLSSEELAAMNAPKGFTDMLGIFLKDIHTINRIEHNSHTFDFGSLNKEFDLIFIDGDHSVKGVINDTQKAFPLRKNSKSVVVWHDYGYNTEDVRYSTLFGILNGLPKEHHKNLFHISNTMCAVYIEDANFPTTFTNFPTFPNKVFSLKVSAKKFEN